MVAKVCCICESSCPEEHMYSIDKKEYYVCDLHYKIIKEMFKDFSKKSTKSTKSKK